MSRLLATPAVFTAIMLVSNAAHASRYGWGDLFGF